MKEMFLEFDVLMWHIVVNCALSFDCDVKCRLSSVKYDDFTIFVKVSLSLANKSQIVLFCR